MAPLVSEKRLGAWLRANYSDSDLDAMVHRVDQVRNRRFDVFGTTVQLNSWHHDPVGDHCYPADVHWASVPHANGVDVKRVWEPSRFSWAYDFARLHLLDPERKAPDHFFELLDWWMQENPPNAGVNWNCGQEASMRLVVIANVVDAMRSAMTPDRWRKINALALETASRVESNIAYAQSQRNNHHTSEAVGLLTAGLLFPHLQGSERWVQEGAAELAAASEDLVFGDGGTSQYSTNYHRVFLHMTTWACAIARRSGFDVGTETHSALERMTEFWGAVLDPTSGCFPLIGHNDGANVLQTSQCAYQDGRPALAAAAAINGRSTLEAGPWDESVEWLGIEADSLTRRPTERPEAIQHFPEFGLQVLHRFGFLVMLRAGPFEFRPSQDDQLHLEVWFRGSPVLIDPGTYSYNPAESVDDNYGDAKWHCTPVLNGANRMRRVSRFLFADWLEAEAKPDSNNASNTCFMSARLGPVSRTVEVRSNQILVTDESADTGWSANYWLADDVLCDLPTVEALVPNGYGRIARGTRRLVSLPLPANVTITVLASGQVRLTRTD